MTDQSFPSKSRIKLQRDFDHVFAAGSVCSDSLLIVHAIQNNLGISRLGLSIGKRFGPAHRRIKVKRWCREAFRTQRHLLPKNLDLVVRVRSGTQPNFDLIRQSILHLVPRVAERISRKK